ncbi:FAD-dependent oxidoreductase [Bacillus sp. FSL W7-1360]
MKNEHHTLTSLWQKHLEMPTYETLQADIHVDVAIIGGGITGVTTAFLLTKARKKVALLDAGRIGGGTTGHTTAKITTQHGLIYDELLANLGQKEAKQYYQAQDEALTYMRQLIEKESISCDFTNEDAYLYATTHHGEHRLRREWEAYQTLELPGEWVTDTPVALGARAAIKVANQAQFHPIHYIAHLCQYMTEQGAQIFEQTACEKVEKDKGADTTAILTKSGARIHAQTIVCATHFPFIDGGGFYMSRLKAERAYVVAAKTSLAWPGGMYMNVEQPTRSLRQVTINNIDHVLVSGETHKAGQGGDARHHYDALNTFAKETFPGADVVCEWSAQDLSTLDHVPYVGPLSPLQPHVLVATGYKKWGMTGGTAAARVLSDLILEGNSLYRELFDPMRFHADPSIRVFLKEGFDIAKHWLSGKLRGPVEDLKELDRGQGAVVKYKGKKAGAFRDENDEIHLVDTTCTHLGCECNWNHADLTWDCPCHGSRYTYRGEVIEGPAKEPLQKLD